MRKLQIMTAALCLLAVAGCKCPCSCSGKKETAAGIVDKMAKAAVVSAQKPQLNSAVVIYDSGLGGKNKSRVTLKFKGKDKLRLEVFLKDYIMLRAYDGKVGWEYVTGKGLHRLKAKELAELRFQSCYLSPDADYHKIFTQIKLDGSGKVAGKECWKLVCTPRSEFQREPVVIFVNKENYYVTKTIERYVEAGKRVEMVTYFGDYENIGGIMMPRLMIFRMDDRFLETKLVSAEWNVDVPDSDFNMPKKLTRGK